jgi:GLPGLI family protein
MIKKLTLILILIYSVSINAQEINAKIIYSKKSSILIDAKKKNSAEGSLLKKAFINMGKIEYILNFNENKSIFKIIDRMDSDVNKNSMAIQLSKSLGGGNGIYFTDRKFG